MPKRLKKSLQERRKGRLWSLWPAGAAGNFAACYALGVLLAVAATFAEHAWSRSGLETPAETAAPPQDARRMEDAAKLLSRGRQHLSTEDFSAAFEDFRQARDLIPTDPRPYHGLGEVYRRIDRAELAEKSYRKALQCRPSFLASKYHLAGLLRYLGKSEESVKLLKELLKESPGDKTFFWLELARNNLRLGKPQEAVLWLEKYTDALPESAFGAAYLGKALAEKGDRKEAEMAYHRSIEINQKQAIAWLWLGQLLIAEGRKIDGDEALGYFRRFRDLMEQVGHLERDLLRRPDDFDTVLKLAKTRTMLGRYREALVAMDRAIKLQPEEKGLLDLRAKVADLARSSGETGGRDAARDSVVPGR